MARRDIQPFNLSLLDLLTSALGAVIFLFIITPKGGASAPQTQQFGVYLDTAQQQVFGLLPDSLMGRQIGDTLRIVLVDYKKFPKEQPPVARPAPKPEPKPEQKPVKPERPAPIAVKNPETPRTETPASKPEEPKPAPPVVNTPVEEKPAPPVYRGDAPSVPCLVSIEVKWADAADNVDLFVCKGNNCVYGGRKRDYAVGQWDSGKSRNRLFGNDLRTNQEAVRQFDKILPGEYNIYAEFKNSDKNHNSVRIEGLVYTKAPNGQERGEAFLKTLPKSGDRVLLGKLVLRADGSYSFVAS